MALYSPLLQHVVKYQEDHFRPDELRTSRMLDLMKISENVATAAAQVSFNPGQAAEDDGL
jgi:hypothetical protein